MRNINRVLTGKYGIRNTESRIGDHVLKFLTEHTRHISLCRWHVWAEPNRVLSVIEKHCLLDELDAIAIGIAAGSLERRGDGII